MFDPGGVGEEKVKAIHNLFIGRSIPFIRADVKAQAVPATGSRAS